MANLLTFVLIQVRKGLIVKTTQKADLPWSAMFSVIVYFEAQHACAFLWTSVKKSLTEQIKS